MFYKSYEPYNSYQKKQTAARQDRGTRQCGWKVFLCISAVEIVVGRGIVCVALLAHPIFHDGFQNKIFQLDIEFKPVVAEGTARKDLHIRLKELFLAAGADQQPLIFALLCIVERLEIV